MIKYVSFKNRDSIKLYWPLNKYLLTHKILLIYEVQRYEPDMRALSLIVTGQSDLSQHPYGLTLAAGVLHDQKAHSLFCAH